MTFFVDANVLVYSRTASSGFHGPCGDLLVAIARGDAEGRTSVAVLEEVWHAELSGKAGDLTGLTEHAYTLFTPLLGVSDAIFRAAMSSDLRRLGANDRIHAATCRANGIGTIVSADVAFDGIHGIRRVDPLDRRWMASLIASGGL